MRSSLSRVSLALVCLVFACGEAFAQTPHELVPVLTSASDIHLSRKFGVPGMIVSNDAGDNAFIGAAGTALFYRKAGTPVAVRAIQFGDELPGLPGSRLTQLSSIFMNSNGVVVARGEVATVGRISTVNFTFDGTTIQTLVTGRDTAPGTGGAKFERAMSLIDLNDNGDVLFGSTLLPVGSTATPLPTIFLKPFGGAVIRVAGPGDASPGTGGTFTAATGVALNNAGQILFHAAITGGSGASGIFAWQSGVLRKVVAAGDPNPLGGNFSDNFTTALMRQNGANLIAFVAANSLWHNTPGGGTAVAAAVGSATPAPMGGTYSSVLFLPALAASGDTIFGASVTGGASSFAFFRFRQGTGTDVIARVNETHAAAPGVPFATFLNFSINAAGTVSCQINSSSGLPIGIFQKPVGGALTAVVLQSAATPVGGTLFLRNAFPTATTATGAVRVAGYTAGAPDAYFGAFLWSATPTTIMSTADLLPAGARTVARTFFLTGAGNTVGMVVFKAGGRSSVVAVHTLFQGLDIAMTEGDVVPNTGGSVLDLLDVTTVQVASSGVAAIEGLLVGGPGGLRDAILVGGGGVPLTAVVYNGILDTGGRTLRTAQIDTRPIAIDSGATVAFTAIVNNGDRGLYTANPFGGPPEPVALVGDVTSTGQPITSINATHGGFNDSSFVLFSANTAAGQGLFLGSLGVTPVKVAQVGDAAPGGGTFSGFGTTPAPALNLDNDVVFIATTTGGPGGGIYMAPSFSPPMPIALNGQAAPGGGTYVLTTPRGDAVINDSGDIAFRADLTAGGSDSGVFLKRAGLPIEVVVTQGQAAPGTPSVFTTLRQPPNGWTNETVALSDDAEVAFFGQVNVPGSEQIAGWWHREPSGALQRIAIFPGTHAEYDGGTASSGASMTNWMFGNTIPMVAPLANGPHVGGLYIWVPVGAGSPTLVGTNVQVSPDDALTGIVADVTFATVSGAGATKLTRTSTGPDLPRGWYRRTGVNGYYNITTTASVSGNITVCINFADHLIVPGAVLRLLHYENSAWVDVTSSGPLNNEICGTVTSLSPFVVAHALNVPTTNVIVNGGFSSGTSNWSTFDGSMVFAVNGGVFEYSRPGGTAVVLQNTGVAVAAGDPVVATWEMGNTSSSRKRFSVLIHDGSFGDLSVCTFWLPPNAPMRPFAMRTHTTAPWTSASISIYAASGVSDAGVYRLDNVVMGPGHALTRRRNDCIDPMAPSGLGSTDGAPMIVNGTFSAGNGAMTDGAHANSPWVAFGSSAGNLTAQVTGGVAQFVRPGTFTQAGALVQVTGIPVAAGQIVSAAFQLGNSSGARKRVTILIHDQSFGDLAACTFWLPAGQPLSQYFMRVFVSAPWSSAMISFYPASNDNPWFTLDNVFMNVTPSAPTYGTDCEEPGDTSALGGAPPPGGELADAALAIRPELLHARFARVMQRLMTQAAQQQ